jgi:hypothetical protein
LIPVVEEPCLRIGWYELFETQLIKRILENLPKSVKQIFKEQRDQAGYQKNSGN